MYNRRKFLKNTSILTLGAYVAPGVFKNNRTRSVGIQLYSVRKEMLEDPTATLKKLAKIGYKELESARSDKGNYYGLEAKQIRKVAGDLGMTVRSGHVHMDKDWKRSIEQAVEAGQQYLVVSSMPYEGQTIDNYKKTAEAFNKGGEDCRKAGLIFGYHNHDYEFEKVGDTVLYDLLLKETDSALVTMELDLGWVVVTGNDPLQYFEKFPGRFPLWHLKDMNMEKKQSTEFGKGVLDIGKMLDNADKSGLKYFFVEQEEYATNAFESIEYDFNYLKKIW